MPFVQPCSSPSPAWTYDFGADFGGDFGVQFDFGASFGFGADFGAAFGDFADLFEESSVSTTELDDVFGDEDNAIGRKRGRRGRKRGRRVRRSNRLYRIESVRTSMWYQRFTKEGTTRQLTHELSSSDRFGSFRHFFSMPLSKVQSLAYILITRGYIKKHRTRFRQVEFEDRTELLVMSALYMLGRGASFRSCQDMCNISTSEVRKFFHVFLNAIVDMRDDQIYMPRSQTELNGVSCFYEHDGLPGCFGSVDVVHVKWSNCPSGDYNRAKGKESYPSLGFQCITDYNRRIMAIYGPHFGTRNDMDIVKTDPYVNSLTTKPLYRDTKWHYYNDDGEVCTEKGMYLICDNGYLRWPTTICPFTQASKASSEGYFSSNIESVRIDVECTFGIIKKRWRILNNGFFYRDIKVCKNIFVTCCWLNNFLLDVMERSTERVGRGAPIARDGIWLSSSTTRNIVVRDMRTTQTRKDRILALEFSRRRHLLVKHLHVFRQKGDLPE